MTIGQNVHSLPLLVHPRCLSISESRDPCKWNDHEQILGCLARNGFPAVIWCWNASLADKYQSFQNPQTSSKSQTSIFLQINTPTPWLANCLASLSATNASDTDRQPRATQKRTHSCPTVQRSEIRLRWLRLWLKLLRSMQKCQSLSSCYLPCIACAMLATCDVYVTLTLSVINWSRHFTSIQSWPIHQVHEIHLSPRLPTSHPNHPPWCYAPRSWHSLQCSRIAIPSSTNQWGSCSASSAPDAVPQLSHQKPWDACEYLVPCIYAWCYQETQNHVELTQ